MAGITLLFKGQQYLAAAGGLYVLLVLLLLVPYFQEHALFLNALSFPFFSDFNSPEKYGLAPNRTLNLYIQTPDNETIGAWFVLSQPYYQSLPSIPKDVSEHVIPALKNSPVVLFFHGNAATRAFSARVRHYQGFGSRLGANVLAIDYRGFGDSTGKPSERGLVRDARAAFDWLISQGKKAEDILIVGHSLGTGVSGQLGAQLASEGIKCKGIVLLSPFASIQQVLETYNLFGLIPLLRPISIIPGAARIVQRAVVHRFDTLQAVPNITANVLIAHAEDDWDIPSAHTDILFDAFLEPYMPTVDAPLDPLMMTEDRWRAIKEQQKARQQVLAERVSTTVIDKFGRVDEFTEPSGRRVIRVKTHYGAHDYLGVQEGLVDIIGKKMFT